MKSLVTVISYVRIYLLGIYHAAVTQGDSGLLGEKSFVLALDNNILNQGVVAALGSLDNGFRILGLYLNAAVQRTLGIVNIHDGLQIACAYAAGYGEFGGTFGGEQRFKGAVYGTGARGKTAAALANNYTCFHFTCPPLREYLSVSSSLFPA